MSTSATSVSARTRVGYVLTEWNPIMLPSVSLTIETQPCSPIANFGRTIEPPVADTRPSSHEGLVCAVQFLAAARLGDDDSVLEDFLVWLGELLDARGMSREVLSAGLDALAPSVVALDPGARPLLEGAQAALQFEPRTVRTNTRPGA